MPPGWAVVLHIGSAPSFPPLWSPSRVVHWGEGDDPDATTEIDGQSGTGAGAFYRLEIAPLRVQPARSG